MPEKHSPGNEGTDRDDRALIDAARGQVEDALEREKQRDRTPPTHTAQEGEPSFDGPPSDSFTGYKIIDEIHRGGQGVVYKALQESTKRKVAIKVMKEGPFAGSSEKARFEREIQILGQLKHPNIVTVYDSGTAAGSFYFVMDYISGQPLDVYMSRKEHSIDDTLKLFATICEAVNSAHLKGVIHRDLKPGNIRIDDEGEPHILDFGLAKVAVSDPEASMMTMTGQFIGSLPWSSPEQAEAAPGKVDIRTDVYSLGVILYQMLTGKFPYDVIGNMRDVLDRIMKAEPARPSTIRKQINDEVETIVLKCLSKERERRYQSAGELSRDVQHYLKGEPIEAKRDSGWYVLKKTIGRYRVHAIVAASFVVFVTASGIGLGLLYREAAAQRGIAEDARQKTEESLTLARQREKEALEARDDLKVVVDFQSSMLGGIDAEAMGRGIFADLRHSIRESLNAQGATPEYTTAAISSFDDSVRCVNPTDLARRVIGEHVLSRAVETIEKDFADQPLVRAALQQTVASTYRDIGLYEPAMPLQEAALQTRREELGDDHQDTLASIGNMGELLYLMGKLSEAEPYLSEALEGFRRVLGDDHLDTLGAMNDMGALLWEMGNLADAEPYYQAALESYRRVLGDDHPHTLTSINNMGALLQSMDKLAEAEPYHREALEGFRRVLGDDHPYTLSSIDNMGLLLKSMGKLAEAEPYYREGLRGHRRVLGDDHPDTLTSISNMGVLLSSMDKLEEAEPYYREALETKRRVLGDDHPDTLASIGNMGRLLQSMGKYDEAEPYYREALETKRRVLGDDHPSTLMSINNMGGLLRDLGRLEEAEALGAEAVRGATAKLGPSHAFRLGTLVQHGRTLTDMQRFGEAETELLEAYEGYVETRAAEDRLTTGAAQALINLYTAWHEAEPDKGHDVEAAKWREKLPASAVSRPDPDADRTSTAPTSQPAVGVHRPSEKP